MSGYWRLSPIALIMPVIIIVLLTLAAYAFNAPVGMVSQLLRSYHPAIVLQAPTGSLWAGQSHIYYNKNYLGLISWDLDFLSLVLLSPRADFRVKKPDAEKRSTLLYDMRGRAHFISNSILVSDLQAKFDLNLLTQSIENSEIQIDGKLTLTDGVIQWDIEPSGRVFWHIPTLASAGLYWSGGQAKIAVGGIAFSQVLPALEGKVRGLGDLKLRLQQPGQKTPLVTMWLTDTGILNSNIHQSLATLMGMPDLGLAPPEKVLYQKSLDLSHLLLH